MVNVTHNGDDGGTTLETFPVGDIDHFRGFDRRRLGAGGFHGHLEVPGDHFDRVHVESLGDINRHPFKK